MCAVGKIGRLGHRAPAPTTGATFFAKGKKGSESNRWLLKRPVDTKYAVVSSVQVVARI
jgi:hypothetical protein